jgi:hypothetical protein
VVPGGANHGNVEVLKTTVMHVRNRIHDPGGRPMLDLLVHQDKRSIRLNAVSHVAVAATPDGG